ncbi:MAG: hypothetical protein C3F07_09935, partial [Anaerolineales bacterium]
MITTINNKQFHFARLGITMVLMLSLLLGTVQMAFASPAPEPLNYWTPPVSVPIVFAVLDTVNLAVPAWTVQDAAVVSTLDDSLFRLASDGSLVPLAGDSYTVSADKLVYTIGLRAGAVWSNNDPVTAQHFVDGILRVLDPSVGSDMSYLLYPIKNAQAFNQGSIMDRNLVGVKALNTQTLEITLEQPASHFPYLMTTPAMLPVRQDLINLYGSNWTLPANYVSNGPYKLVEYDTEHVLIEKSLAYNGPIQAVFSQMGFSTIGVVGDQIAAYKNGTVDVLLSAPTGTVANDPALKNDLVTIPSPGTSIISFMNKVAPTNNPLVRKALASAVDRQVILDNILKTPWRVEATGMIPPELDGYQGSAVGYSYDPAQAQAFLAQAGYPGGAGFPTLNLMAVTGGNNALVFEEVEKQWETVLGITVNIHYFSSSSDYNSALGACLNDPLNCTSNGYIIGWFVDYPDAYNILRDFNLSWRAQWNNSSYESLMDLAASETNQAQRINYFRQAEKILVEDDAAVMPLYHYDGAMLVRPGIYPYYTPSYYQNLAQWSNVDPVGDGAVIKVVNAAGGTVTAEDNSASITIPPSALSADVSISVTYLGGDYQITTSQVEQNVLSSFSIQPHGLQFSVPVTLTFSWDDADNDGIVDGSSKRETKIKLIKDGIALTPDCEVYAGCNMAANTISVQVSSLSHFELVIPLASFGDVSTTYWAWSFIERLYAAGITGGCGGGNFCPDTPVTRAQMAVFL